MARSVEEWIGMSDDAAIPVRVRARVFLRFGGRCCNCTKLVGAGRADWQADHIVALINGGANRESNLHVLCVECHKQKTGDDSATKAKTYAIRKGHLGLKKSKGRPMPGTKRSGFRRRMNGTVEKW